MSEWITCPKCGVLYKEKHKCPKEFQESTKPFEKLPPHAKRAYSVTGGLLPEPRYNIAIDGTWVGEYKELESYPWLGKVFFPTNWETKRKAVQEAKLLIEGIHSPPFYMGEKDMAKATVEVVECFGSYPQDRATVWKNGQDTYIYEA